MSNIELISRWKTAEERVVLLAYFFSSERSIRWISRFTGISEWKTRKALKLVKSGNDTEKKHTTEKSTSDNMEEKNILHADLYDCVRFSNINPFSEFDTDNIDKWNKFISSQDVIPDKKSFEKFLFMVTVDETVSTFDWVIENMDIGKMIEQENDNIKKMEEIRNKINNK